MLNTPTRNSKTPGFKHYTFIDETFSKNFHPEAKKALNMIMERSHIRFLNATRGCEVYVAGAQPLTLVMSAVVNKKSIWEVLKNRFKIGKDTQILNSKNHPPYFEYLKNTQDMHIDTLEESLFNAMTKVSKEAKKRFG